MCVKSIWHIKWVGELTTCLQHTVSLTSCVVAPGIGKPAGHPNGPQHRCWQLRLWTKKMRITHSWEIQGCWKYAQSLWHCLLGLTPEDLCQRSWGLPAPPTRLPFCVVTFLLTFNTHFPKEHRQHAQTNWRLCVIVQNGHVRGRQELQWSGKPATESTPPGCSGVLSGYSWIPAPCHCTWWGTAK